MNLTSVTVSADIARAASKSPNNTPTTKTSIAQSTINTQATNLIKQQPINAIQPPAAASQSSEDMSKNDSVKVSSSIGRAASSGQLSREEALAIYQKIASLL